MSKPCGSSDELLVKLTRYLDYFQALTSLAKALTAEIQLEDVLQVLMRCISQLLRPRNWSLLLLDEPTQQLYFAIAVGDAAERAREARLQMGTGVAGWAAEHRQALVVPRVADDARFRACAGPRTGSERASVLCAPLVSRGRLLGVIELVREEEDEAEPFGQEHLQLLQPFSDFAAIAIDNARSFQRIQELTVVDEWTSLYNARFLATCVRDEVTRARRYDHELSIVFFDLDRFKAINDSFGHAAGSAVLREIGTVLLANVRETDRAVRYGGDEFIVVMPETGKQGAMSLAERMRDALTRACFEKPVGNGVSVSASFGVATFPHDASSSDTLLEAADRAMYLAKARGRDTVADAGELAAEQREGPGAPPTVS